MYTMVNTEIIFFLIYIHILSYLLQIVFFFQIESYDHLKRLSIPLFTGLHVCSMQLNCLYVISLQNFMVKLSVRGALQDQLVSYFLRVKIWLLWNFNQLLILIWTLNPLIWVQSKCIYTKFISTKWISARELSKKASWQYESRAVIDNR